MGGEKRNEGRGAAADRGDLGGAQKASTTAWVPTRLILVRLNSGTSVGTTGKIISPFPHCEISRMHT